MLGPWSISLFRPARLPTSARIVDAAGQQTDPSERTIEKFLSRKYRNLRVSIYVPVARSGANGDDFSDSNSGNLSGTHTGAFNGAPI
jgi:hypothetical protein